MKSEIKKLIIAAEARGFEKATKGMEDLNKAGGRVAATQDKLEKGTSAMGKNATANFAKMSQGLGGLVHVYATVAANVFALGSAFMVLKNATDVDIMVRAADQLSTSTGISYANVAKNMKNVTQGALSMQEALRSASIGVSSGLSGKQMQDIAEIATKAANALGRSVPEAINRMTQAVVKNEPELVDEYGIILRVDSAMKDYAATLGKTKAELTSFDKQMAIHAQLVKQGATKFGDVEGQVNAYNQLGASFGELTHNVVSFINTALEPLASLFAENKSLLAALAAIFAHGVFKRAVPELQNMNSKLKEQRKYYTDLIAQQKERLSDLKSIGKAQEIEVGFKNVPTRDLMKKGADIFRSLPMDILKNEFDEAAIKGLKSGTMKGIKEFGKELSKTSYMKNVIENMDLLNNGTVKQRDLALKNLKTYGLQETKARQLVTIYQILTGEIKKQHIDSKVELSYMDKKKLKLQEMTAELQMQRTISKDLRASAFSAGASGGFLGGGLAEANKKIKAYRSANEKVSMLSAGAARVAGIFGNITGALGSIMSLVSGWGIALFAVSQVIAPISDGIGLTNKEARKSLDSFEDLTDEVKKLQETSEKINTRGFEDLQGLIDKTSASANNLNEQMSKTIEQLDTLGQIAQLTFLDKLFNFDLNAQKNAIKDIVSSIEDMRTAKGIEQDTNLQGQVENYAKISAYAQNIKDLIADQKDRQDGWFTSASESAEISEYIKTLQKKLTGILEEQERVKDSIYEKDKKALQLERDRQDLMSKAKNSVADLAKAEAARRNKFAKSSPYFETIKHLENQRKLLDELHGQEKELTSVREEYNNALNLSISSNAKFSDYIDYQLDKNRELSRLSLQSKNEELDIKTRMAVIDDKIAKGDMSSLKEKINLNTSLVNIKIKQLEAEKAKFYFTALTNDTLDDIENRELAILNIDKQIAKLLTDNNIANKNILNSNKNLTKELDKQLAIINAQKSGLSDAKAVIDIQKGMGSISGEDAISAKWAIDRAESLNKQKQYQTEINKLLKLNTKQGANIGANNAKISDYQSKISLEVYKTNTLLGETNRLREQSKRIREKELAIATKEISNAEKTLNIAESLAGKKPTGSALDNISGASALVYDKKLAKSKKIQAQLLKEIQKAEEGSLKALELKTKLTAEELEQYSLKVEYEQKLLEISKERHEAAKRATNAATIFEDPKGFTQLLGKEFDILSKNFSDSLMDPVTRASDSILRITDTAIDTLFEAAAAGENVGKAIMDAVVAVANDITTEITTDIMKGWTREWLATAFGIEDEATARHKAMLTEQENQLRIQKQIEVNTRKSMMSTSSAGGLSSFQIPNLGLNNQSDLLSEQIQGTSAEAILNGKEWANWNVDATNTGNSLLEQGFSSLSSSLSSMTSSMFSMLPGIGSGLTSTGSGLSGIIGGAFDFISSIFGQGGITNSLNRYANGTVTNGPELALIGDNNSGKEAVVPLPSGDKIPVEFSGDSTEGDTIINNNITIQGNSDDPAAIRRSAGQVAQAAGNATQRAMQRNN